MILETRQQHWPDEAACAASGAALAARAGIDNAFIELRGPLGAGKTTFVRHLLRALGVQGRVKSPTYALLESYEVTGCEPTGAGSTAPEHVGDSGRLQVHHFDFYRFDDPQEWEDAGFREVFAGPGLKLVEWPDKAEGLLPVADLEVWIEPVDGAHDAGPAAPGGLGGVAREVRFVACTALGIELLGAFSAAGESR